MNAWGDDDDKKRQRNGTKQWKSIKYIQNIIITIFTL